MKSPFSFARRLTVQLALALVVASVAPIAGAAFVVSGLFERTLEREARGTQETLLGASKSLVDGHVGGARSKLATIAKIIVSEDFAVPRADVKADASNREDLAKRLNVLLTPSETFLELSYYSFRNPGWGVAADVPDKGINDGTYRAQAMQHDYQENLRNNSPRQQQALPGTNDLNSLNPIPASADSPRIPLDDPLVRVPKGGSAFVSGAIWWVGEIPYIQMSVPVGEGPSPAGVLVATVSLAPVREMLTSVGSGKAVVALKDAAGAELSGDGPAAGGDALESRGAPSDLGWTLSVRQPRSEALATLTAARRQAWGWFGAAVALALLIALFFTARILPPVRALTGAAERMARGDLKARTNVTRDDELGRLARSFDEMAEALEKLDQMKSDFVSHVSHELRTPLTSIKLSVANLQEGILGPVGERQLVVLGRVREDLDRLIRMVNEILDAARLEAGKIELAREACDLGAIAQGAVETVRPLAAAKGVRLVVETAAAPASGDRAKLHEVLLNVLDNAVKFTPSGGEVLVRVATRDGAAEAAITDGGPGIPEGKLTRIFEKFGMIPADGAPKPPGAGLGLSITRKIVELHGGTIVARNAATGTGATFLIRLPPV